MKEIPLTRGMAALVDDDMYDYLSQWKWHAQKGWNTYYAVRRDNSRTSKKAILMHRVIANAPDDMPVDHKNGNGLYNLRLNLRVCTNTENGCNRQRQKNNTTGFTGVHWMKNAKKYEARIQVNNKQIYLGLFDDPFKAAEAYDSAAKIHHGDFASLNLSK